MAKNRVSRILPKALDPIHRMRVVGRLVRRAAKRPGSQPGTLVHTGEQKLERIHVHVMTYDTEGVAEEELERMDAALIEPPASGVRWVNVDGLHDIDAIRVLGEHQEWHPLMLEDIVSVGQRAKMEEYEGEVFLVLPMLSWDAEHAQVVEEQVSIVLGQGYVFTFQERTGDVFDVVRERLRAGRGRIRTRGADYLAYALVDAVVDHYLGVLEAVGDLTEQIETEVLAGSGPDTMHRLHALKRELIAVRRAVWPLRDMLIQLLRSEGFSKETRVFARDVLDHATQAAEAVDTLRDVVGGAVDLHISTLGIRTNEVMKVLTITASIFIPLTFLAGIYGMNFDHMPELHLWWAYPALLAVMAAIAFAMLAYFKRRGWM